MLSIDQHKRYGLFLRFCRFGLKKLVILLKPNYKKTAQYLDNAVSAIDNSRAILGLVWRQENYKMAECPYIDTYQKWIDSDCIFELTSQALSKMEEHETVSLINYVDSIDGELTEEDYLTIHQAQIVLTSIYRKYSIRPTDIDREAQRIIRKRRIAELEAILGKN